jgi:hypothetical protein
MAVIESHSFNAGEGKTIADGRQHLSVAKIDSMLYLRVHTREGAYGFSSVFP